MSAASYGPPLTQLLNIFTLIFVPTTVHLPPRLLASAARRARALGISRNRLIIRALEREVGEAQTWSEEFLQALRQVDVDVAQVARSIGEHVVRRRRSKRPPTL